MRVLDNNLAFLGRRAHLVVRIRPREGTLPREPPSDQPTNNQLYVPNGKAVIVGIKAAKFANRVRRKLHSRVGLGCDGRYPRHFSLLMRFRSNVPK